MKEMLEASNIETLRTQHSKDFLAKYTFFVKILPFILDTNHDLTIVECFNNPMGAPYRGGDGFEPVIPREWPTDSAELLSELNGRVESLQSRITRMIEKKTSQGVLKPKIDPEDVRVVEEVLNRPENLELQYYMEFKKRASQVMRDYFNPEKIPEIEQKLLETKNARTFIQGLREEGKI